MASYNRVILMGNLTRDPEVRYLPSNMAVVDIGLAVNERFQDKQSGEWQERANFFDCTAFGKSAESIGRFFSKGRPILIEGKLRLDQWDDKQTGQKRSKVKIIIDQWNFCDSRGGGDGGGSGGRSYGGNQAGGGQNYGGGSRGGQSSGVNYDSGPAHQPIEEDDIPF
ncbi:MAG: single-stranded DNA-binding protein [Planctomycetota bacterium]